MNEENIWRQTTERECWLDEKNDTDPTTLIWNF